MILMIQDHSSKGRFYAPPPHVMAINGLKINANAESAYAFLADLYEGKKFGVEAFF
jgi:hypothetical protein